MKRNNETDAAIHLSLQGKGGVGKSLVASILAQYFIHRGTTIRCIDTDPVNQTFAQYKRLPVERVKLIRDGGIDQRGFDGLMETLLTSEGVFVVDNGASTFVPLWNYFLENNTLELLRHSGRHWRAVQPDQWRHRSNGAGQRLDAELEPVQHAR